MITAPQVMELRAMTQLLFCYASTLQTHQRAATIVSLPQYITLSEDSSTKVLPTSKTFENLQKSQHPFTLKPLIKW